MSSYCEEQYINTLENQLKEKDAMIDWLANILSGICQNDDAGCGFKRRFQSQCQVGTANAALLPTFECDKCGCIWQWEPDKDDTGS